MKKNILVFFSYKSHKFGYIEMLFRRLTDAATDRPLILHRGALNELHIEIKDSKLRITESLTGKDLREFDGVYFELWYKAQQQALAAATYLNRHGIPYVSQELSTLMPVTKIGELAILADGDVPLPNTFIASRREIKRVFRRNPPVAFPLIAKAADGYGGKNNYLVKDYAQLKEIVDTHKNIQFVLQEFIPNECDYRCLVFGETIKLVLRRTRDVALETHLNNTSAGAAGEIVDVSVLSPEAQKAAIAAAKRVGRGQFAGVDLMLHAETGAPYVLEVNQTPQIEIGAEVDKKMAALLDYLEEMTA